MRDLMKMGGAVQVGDLKPTKESIELIEREWMVHPLRIPHIPHIDHMAPGLYAREMRIAAGTKLTGRTHKTEHLNILAAGEMTIWTEEGVVRITAPYIFVSKPGVKRIGLAHTDSVFITFHPTDKEDIDQIVEDIADSDADQPLIPFPQMIGE